MAKRFYKDGIDGLKNRPKSSRPPVELSKGVSYMIKKELKESGRRRWTTKQVEELIVKKCGIKYHYTHIFRILRKWGFKQKVPGKVHVYTAFLEEKMISKKVTEILADKQEEEEKGFTVVSLDESFFFYDILEEGFGLTRIIDR
ncbi:MAG: winged helix-turn-helix domain-containing protein [Candidatus Nitrosocosmicus sp.]